MKVDAAVKECASFGTVGPNDTRNWCWPADRSCRVLTKQRCKWFEVAVLPLFPGVEAIYREQHQIAQRQDTVTRRNRCRNCQSIFYRKSNRQALCEDCTRLERQAKQREYQRQHRQRQKGG